MDIMLSPFTACSCCTLSNAEAFLMPSLCILGKLATLEYSGWHLLFNSGMVYYQFLLISKLVALYSSTANAADIVYRTVVPHPSEMSLLSVLLV